jgi:hypothetical protein
VQGLVLHGRLPDVRHACDLKPFAQAMGSEGTQPPASAPSSPPVTRSVRIFIKAIMH